MSNLTGLNHGVFNTLHLVDPNTLEQTEVRDMFLQGSIEQTIPAAPTASQLLSIPGLLTELGTKRDISNSYSKNQVDLIVQNSVGQKGDKGDNGASITGQKGAKGDNGASITGQKGDKGDNGLQGIKGQKGEIGLTGSGIKGQKGEIGLTGSGIKGQKGEIGASTTGTKGQKGEQGQKGEIGASTTGTKGQKGEQGNAPSNVYTKSEIDAFITAQNNAINANTQNQISNQLDISQNIQQIINLQVAVSMLQVADNNINATLTSLQNQINAIPAPMKIETSGTQRVPKILTFQGTGLGSVGWFPTTEELVLSFN